MRGAIISFLLMLLGGQLAAADEPKSGDPKLEHFQLDNGLKVLVRPVRGAGLVALMVLYDIGGDHDPKGQSGLAHTMEHLYVTAAAGTEKARSVDEFMKRYSHGWEAHTGDRFTVVATVFAVKDLDSELQDAAARMGDLHIRADDLQRERPRIEEELDNMFGRLPVLAAFNRSRELLRPTPRNGRRGGMIEQVKALTVDDVQQRWQRYYKPKNALLVVTGGVDSTAIRKAITTHFGKLPSGEAIPPAAEPGKPQPGTVQEIAVRPLDPQAVAQVGLAYAAPLPASDRYAPYLVLATRLSRAARKARAADHWEVYFVPSVDPAVLSVALPVREKETAAMAVERAERLVAEILKAGLTSADIAAVKDELGFMLGLVEVPDSPFVSVYGLALRVGRCQQMGIDSAEVRKALEGMTDEELHKAAQAIFAPERHGAAYVSIEK